MRSSIVLAILVRPSGLRGRKACVVQEYRSPSMLYIAVFAIVDAGMRSHAVSEIFTLSNAIDETRTMITYIEIIANL